MTGALQQAIPVSGKDDPRLAQAIAQLTDGQEQRRPAGTTGTARQAIDLLRGLKLGAFRLPKHAGGSGGSLDDLLSIVLRLAEADSNIPHILRNHFVFVEGALLARNTAKYAPWLAEVGRGKLIGTVGSEESVQKVGSGAVETLLSRGPDGHLLTGRKLYTTGALYFDYVYVSARTPEGKPAGAVVPTNRTGVDIHDDWDGMGQRLTASGSAVFDQVAVSEAEAIEVGEDTAYLPYFATLPQLYLTTIVAGVLRAIVRDASHVLKNRGRNFYHALVDTPDTDPLLHQTIGRLSSIAYVAEVSVSAAANALSRAYDSAQAGKADTRLFLEAALAAAKAKTVIDDLALSAASQLFDVAGASAARQSLRLDRHWQNIRTLASHNPVSYKARALGEHVVHGTPLPTGGFF